jgi:hypothetical protein
VESSILSLYLLGRGFSKAKSFNKSQADKKAVFEQGLSIWNQKMQHWNNAMQRWNSLYYCNRDDCVFIPGTNTFAPSSNMIDYIYRE